VDIVRAKVQFGQKGRLTVARTPEQKLDIHRSTQRSMRVWEDFYADTSLFVLESDVVPTHMQCGGQIVARGGKQVCLKCGAEE